MILNIIIIIIKYNFYNNALFLDQSRVVRPLPTEKNYHVFYQVEFASIIINSITIIIIDIFIITIIIIIITTMFSSR